MQFGNKYLIVIGGPTAVGKTTSAISLAEHYQTVVISADSRQFYKEMTIGTAKPSEEELQSVKHYFINNKHIGELYGAGHFAKEAEELIQNLFISHDKIIVVGGSGLYLNALLEGVDEFDEVPLTIREELNSSFEEKGIDWLKSTLQKVDPDYYAKVDTNNPQRMIRALEVYRHSGMPYSMHIKRKKVKKPYQVIAIYANMLRGTLYERINTRVDKMMLEGLLTEVKTLLPYKNVNALKTVGYKELFDYLEGKYSLSEAVEKIKQHSRNYAKRQITWFKNKTNFVSFDPTAIKEITAYIDQLSK